MGEVVVHHLPHLLPASGAEHRRLPSSEPSHLVKEDISSERGEGANHSRENIKSITEWLVPKEEISTFPVEDWKCISQRNATIKQMQVRK